MRRAICGPTLVRMPAPPYECSCPGTGGDPVEVADDTGICPVCGRQIALGYAGLLPKHESPTRPRPITVQEPLRPVALRPVAGNGNGRLGSAKGYR